MKSFVVADLSMFLDWNWDDWKDDTGEIGERMKESSDPISEVVIPEMEKLRPITINQAGGVYGVEGNYARTLVFPEYDPKNFPFTDTEFDLLWSEFGFKNVPIEED